MMSPRTRRTAGFILLLYAVILLGGLLLLVLYHAGMLSLGEVSMAQSFYGAGYTQATLTLVLSLVMLRYVDDALLNDRAKAFVRISIPTAAVAGALGLVLSQSATEAGPTALVFLTYISALVLIVACLILASGLLRR